MRPALRAPEQKPAVLALGRTRIRRMSASAQESVLLCDEDFSPVAHVLRERSRARASRTGAPPAGLPVRVLLASSELGVRYLPVPERGREAWRQAVGYALEEQLVGEVEAQHFALPERLEGRVPVAWLPQTRLAAGLERLRALGIEPHALHPLAAALPADSVWLEGERAHVHLAGELAATLDAELAATLYAGRGLEVFGNAPEHADPRWGAVVAQPDPLARIVQQARWAMLPNLLHGRFAPATRRAHDRLWRWAAAAVAASLVLGVAAEAFSLWRLATAVQEVEARRAALFDELVPGEPLIDPARQVHAALVRIGQVQGGDDLLAALQRIGPILYSEARLDLISLEYRDGGLELGVRGPDVATLDGLRQRLATLPGASVDLGQVNSETHAAVGRLKLRFGARG